MTRENDKKERNSNKTVSMKITMGPERNHGRKVIDN